MKKIGALLGIMALAMQSTALAWIGGPYSNNTYDGFDGGIFSGSIRGKRCTGIFKFSQNTGGSYVSPFGDSIIYFKGIAYYGEAYGWIDTVTGTASGVTNGLNNGGSNDGLAALRSIFGNGFGVNNGIPDPDGTGASGGTAFSNGANTMWNGKIKSKRPTIRFEGKGEASFFGSGTTTMEKRIFDATGDFFEPRQGPNLETLDPVVGTQTQIIITTDDFPNVTDTIRIRVTGGRTSTTPFLGPVQYQSQLGG